MMRMTPLRRITLHLSHMRFTEARTFISLFLTTVKVEADSPPYQGKVKGMSKFLHRFR